MFEYNKEEGNIKLTRGDTAYLNVAFLDGDGNPLDLAGVEICMSVRMYYDTPILFQIPADESGMVKISPEHTADLDFGTYRYDIQATLPGGDVTTYGPYRFKVLPEVTY